jgi:hypothetical protein
MAGIAKQRWCDFRRGRPGHRFQQRFEENKQARAGRSSFMKCLKPAAALVIIAAGVVLCFIPGPGLLLIFIGASLLADVSRPVARALDWLEVRIRKVIARGRRWWNHASRTAKYAVVILGVFVASGAAYGGLRIVMTRMH